MAFRTWFLGLLAAVSTGAASPVLAQGVASAAPLAKGTDPGEVLMGELQCIACHGADRATADRLGNRPAPLLGAAGLRLEPQWIRAWLAGSTPEDVAAGTSREEILESARLRALDRSAMLGYGQSLLRRDRRGAAPQGDGATSDE